MSRPGSVYAFGPFRLDAREHHLLRDGQAVPLTPKMFDLLQVLVERAGHLVEKEALLEEVWRGTFVEEAALNRGVSVLRKALGERPDRIYIETVPKRGYRFVAAVTALHEPAQPPAREPVLEVPRRRGVRPSRIIAAAGATMLAVASSYGVLRPSSDELRSEPPAPRHRQVTFAGNEGSPALSPDGLRIAYVSTAAPEKKLIVQELAGGRPLEIFSAPEIGYLRWSPDGSQLLAWLRGAGWNGIYLLPQLGGSPRPIMPGQFVACWSPDGSTIAVTSYIVGKIWLVDTAGGVRRTLSLEGDHASIWDIDWSAASNRLVFASSDRHSRYGIWTISPDGAEQQQILSSTAELTSARWTPRGDGVYYFERTNQTVSLYRVAAAGGHTPAARGEALLSGLETDRTFSLSADGARLVYARAPYYSNLWMLDAATGEVHALTRGTTLIERPRVSPDGRAVAFNVGHDPVTNLFTLPIAGGTPRQLTFFNALTVGAAWSPDGSRLAFGSTQGGVAGVWTVPAAGGAPRSLAPRIASDNLDVAWSPGAAILYQIPGNRTYHAVDWRTGAERPVVPEDSPGWMFAPVYSPDGHKIAVMWNRRPVRGIWLVEAASRSARPLYRSDSSSIMPIGWSRDGRSVFVVEGMNAMFRGATSFLGETMTAAKVVRVGEEGSAEVVAPIPAEEIGAVTMTPDGRRFIYPVFSSSSDVWVVDSFDRPVGCTPRTPCAGVGSK